LSLPLQITRSLKHSPRGHEVSSISYAIVFKLTYRQLSVNFCPHRSLWNSSSQATPAPCTQICHHGFLSEAKSLTLVPVSLQAMPRQLRGPTSCFRFGLLICSLQVAQETVSLQYALTSVVSTTSVQTNALGPTLDGHIICPFTFLTIGIDARQCSACRTDPATRCAFSLTATLCVLSQDSAHLDFDRISKNVASILGPMNVEEYCGIGGGLPQDILQSGSSCW
jgi:hypothetical protein